MKDTLIFTYNFGFHSRQLLYEAALEIDIKICLAFVLFTSQLFTSAEYLKA